MRPSYKFSRLFSIGLTCFFLLQSCTSERKSIVQKGPRWIAGDHHIHSRFSVTFNTETDSLRTSPIKGIDAFYPIPMNALMARRFGLSWMVATDHGGPNHSKVNLEQAYPELTLSRELVPEVIQFFGMELNPPGGDHSSLIIPHSDDEAQKLFLLESEFDRNEVFPIDPERNNESRMIQALELMDKLEPKPIVIVNHPSRSGEKGSQYGLYDPAELRKWNDTAPEVSVGMAGAPGHQASTLNPDNSPRPDKFRGGYSQVLTMGGFDPMTARLGGFWDSMLGEGRRWWITANSDSHIHYTEGGDDFWPGEFSKTYVYSEKSYDAILNGIRSGQVFVTTGDLISLLYLSVESGTNSVQIGGTIEVPTGTDIEININFMDPEQNNHYGENPFVSRVDLITGKITGKSIDQDNDRNSSTHVLHRFYDNDWSNKDDYKSMTYNLKNITESFYLRVRGTNTSQLEPLTDEKGENPWDDLWFYSNPIFVQVQ
ncbi:MAG: phosphoesterase [Candidatus Marinimicrobia bacterium]|nr:phosphoesterase [Candidatus Neomarinimicrobiota bacterium]